MSEDTANILAGGQVGHVFGKLGQGTATLPAGNKGWAWQKMATTNTPGILVSVLPSVQAATLADKKNITVEASGLGWHNQDDFDLPAWPAAATDPDTTGAVVLAATLIAVSTVSASLF